MDASIDFSGILRGSIADEGGGGGDGVVITPVVTSGTKIADVSVNGVEKDLYCPTAPEVDITPVVTSGTKIADVSVNGVEKDLYCPTVTPTEVTVTQVQQSGTKIATIGVNGVNTDLYAPSGGGVVYSTTEQVIGEWIDGRPLYQFVGITNGSVTLDNYDYRTIPLSYLPQNIDMLISAVITRETPNVGGNIRFYASNGNITGASLNQYNLSSGMLIIFTFVKTS